MSGWVCGLLAGAAAAVAAGGPSPDRLRQVAGGGGRTSKPTGEAGRAGAVPLVHALRPGRRLLPVVVGLAVLLLRGPMASALAVGAVLLTRRSFRVRAGRALRAAERSGAVEACAALSSELRSGRTPADALLAASGSAVAAVAVGLSNAAAAARLGSSVPAALSGAAAASAAPEVLLGLSACWQVCATTGSGLAAAVDRLADGLRAEQLQRLDVEAELAGPRATAALLAVLPLAGIALSAALGARPVHVLLDTPFGAGCLVVGLALDLAGVWWTGRIVLAAGGNP